MKKLDYTKENLRLLASIIAHATSGSLFTKLLTDGGWSSEITYGQQYQTSGKNKEDFLFDEFVKIGENGREDILDYIAEKTIAKSSVYFKRSTKEYKFPKDQLALLKKKMKIKSTDSRKTNERLFIERKFHSSVTFVSKHLFVDGHYSQSIFEACKLLNKKVQEKSGNVKDGKALMLEVFSPNNPVLKFNNGNSVSDKDEQEGLMHIYAGLMQGVRNPKGHDLVVQKDKFRTLDYLTFISILFKKLDETNS